MMYSNFCVPNAIHHYFQSVTTKNCILPQIDLVKIQYIYNTITKLQFIYFQYMNTKNTYLIILVQNKLSILGKIIANQFHCNRMLKYGFRNMMWRDIRFFFKSFHFKITIDNHAQLGNLELGRNFGYFGILNQLFTDYSKDI